MNHEWVPLCQSKRHGLHREGGLTEFTSLDINCSGLGVMRLVVVYQGKGGNCRQIEGLYCFWLFLLLSGGLT